MPFLPRSMSAGQLALLLLLAPARMLASQAADSARTSFARELIAAASARDTATLRALIVRAHGNDSSAFAIETRTTLTRLGAQARGLTIVKLEPQPTGFFVTVRASAAPRNALLSVSWFRDTPGRFRRVQWLKSWDPAADTLAPTRARSASEIPARIDAYLGGLTRIGAFSGSVLVARGDSIVLSRGYGVANLDDSVRNTSDTRYAIASMGKMFTAVSIAQFIEQGRLRLDDTLSRVLPDYPNPARAATITIRDLLAHTAGLGDIWSHPAYQRDSAYRSNQELAWTLAPGALQFTPGTRWAYSNEGYIVLGAIIERLSGAPFERYLREHIWTPAGMRGVAIAGIDRIVPHRAIGYAPADDDLLAIEPLRPQLANGARTNGAMGAGGEVATTTDLLRFVSALRGGRLVSRAMVDTLLAPRHVVLADVPTRYGFGIERFTIGATDFAGHGGGGGYGIDNMLYFSTSGPWTIVVLGNRNPPNAVDPATVIARFLAGGGGGSR